MLRKIKEEKRKSPPLPLPTEKLNTMGERELQVFSQQERYL